MTVLGNQVLQDFLDALHAKSDEQAALIQAFEAKWDSSELSPSAEEIRAFRSDKLVALDRDKAEFCYQLCRAKKSLQNHRGWHVVRCVDHLPRCSRARQC